MVAKEEIEIREVDFNYVNNMLLDVIVDKMYGIIIVLREGRLINLIKFLSIVLLINLEMIYSGCTCCYRSFV